MKTILKAVFLVSTLAFAPLHAAEISHPDCAAIESWSGTYDSNANIEPLPGWQVNALFGDDKTQALFGKKVATWENADTTALNTILFQCRKEAAARKDSAMVKLLTQVTKETKTTYKQLRKVWSARKAADNTVKNILSKRDASGDYLHLLELTAESINGKDISAEVNELPRAWYGYGKMAQDISVHTSLLTRPEKQALVDQLDIRRQAVTEAVAEQDAAQQALLDSIASVPNDASGLSQLIAISSQVDASKMSPEDYAAYNAAFQARRLYIQNLLASQEAAEKTQRMSTPAAVVARMGELLQGDEVEEVQIGELVLESPLSSIRSQILNDWQLKETPTMALDRKEFTTTRNQLEASLKNASHDAGYIKLRTFNGRVGEIIYQEHYAGPMPALELKQYLEERFGSADRVDLATPAAIDLFWEDGDRLLQITASNTVTFERQLYDVRSHVVISVWSEDFDRYLREGDERCRAIAEKPQQSLSIAEKQDYMMGCRKP